MHCFSCQYPVVPWPFVKVPFCLLWIALSLLVKIIWLYMHGLISGRISFVQLIFISIPSLMPHRSIIKLEKKMSTNVWYFPRKKKPLYLLGCLYFHVHFRISLSISILSLIRIMIGIVINLLIVLVAQSCLTLCNPMGCSLPGSSVHGILQARILEWVAMPFSEGSFWPRKQTHVTWIVNRFFTVWAIREVMNL